jgi:hypothetical protein
MQIVKTTGYPSPDEQISQSLRDRFLQAIHKSQIDAVFEHFKTHTGNHFGARPYSGLVQWHTGVTGPWPGFLPAKIPRALIKAYLTTPSLQPCNDCEDCSLHVPTEFVDGKPTNEMFPRCPGCGGRTGLNAFSGKRERE